MKKTKIQAMIDLLEKSIKNIDGSSDFKTMEEYINGTQSAYKYILKKAIEIQNNDDLD